MYHNKITAKGIPPLVALKELTMLDVSCTVMKASGIKTLQETFPQLISLQARGCQLDDQSLEYILAMPNLRKVDISSNKSLSENAVQAFIAKACGHGLAVIASS